MLVVKWKSILEGREFFKISLQNGAIATAIYFNEKETTYMSKMCEITFLNAYSYSTADCGSFGLVIGASLSEPHNGGSRFNCRTVVAFPKVYARTRKAPHC